MEHRTAKILFSKSGKGSLTTRITLPVSWLKQMGVHEKNRDMDISFNGEEIKIKIKEAMENDGN